MTRGLHGRAHFQYQNRLAALLLIWGVGQVALWTLLLALDLVGMGFAQHLFRSVTFLSQISVWALVLAALAQVAGSLAQRSANHAHADAEHNRAALTKDTAQLAHDIADLAELQPGPDAVALAARINAQLTA